MNDPAGAIAAAMRCLGDFMAAFNARDAFDSVYVVTPANGHWGVKMRSGFAP